MYVVVKYPNNLHKFIQDEANIVTPPEQVIDRARSKRELKQKYNTALDATGRPFGWIPGQCE